MTNNESRQAWRDMLTICERRPEPKHDVPPRHIMDGDAKPLYLEAAEHGMDEVRVVGHGAAICLPTVTGNY